VLNLSLGGGGACGATMQAAVAGARARGAVVVVAAGNETRDASTSTPGNCIGVLNVAATTRRGGRAPYSNYGAKVTLAAPGGAMSSQTDPNGILSTLNDGTRGPGNDIYAYYQGTSMATPHVAGVAALMMSRDAALTGDEAIALLRASAHATALGCAGCGAGLIDAGKAVTSVLPAGSASPRVAATEPNEGRATAQVLASLPVKVAGTISSTADVDTFKVYAPAHGVLRARLLPGPTSTYSLTLMGGAGKVLATRSNAPGFPEAVTFTNPNATATMYYLQVRYVSGAAGANGRYTLEAWTQ
jgi:serine protease